MLKHGGRWGSMAVVLAAGLAICASHSAWAQGAKEVGVASNVKVLSDKVEDVSSPEAWKQSCIKPGMSGQEKAVAVWKRS